MVEIPGNAGESQGMNNVPRVMNPYRGTALQYREKWFKGVLALPFKEKEAPETGFTGKRAPYPTLDEIKKWCEDGKKHNICIRLAGVDDKYELIGIDVDDYIKGGKKKDGYAQLQKFEKELGPLPQTWTSSARTDGHSGIRYFRVPRGYAFKGKLDKDIEIIQKSHRYAIVWPSIHPEGGLYWWFGPGVALTKEGRNEWDGQIPLAREFPLLPDSWFKYLSSNGTLAVEDEIIDVDSAVQEIYDWATATFHKADCNHADFEDDGKGNKIPVECSEATGCADFTMPCELMRSKLEKHKKLIEDEATSHDKLTNAHWNLLHLAFEGHLGWNVAVNELEEHFENVTMDRGKRGLSEVHGEIFRSRIQALRQIKGKSDERTKIGAKAVDTLCTKVGICGTKGASSGTSNRHLSSVDVGNAVGHGVDDGNSSSVDGNNSGNNEPPDELDDIPKGALKGIEDYETNDDGNGAHFCDYFSSLASGPSFRFAEGFGWIVWHEGSGDGVGRYPHWQTDELGNQQIRRMWHKVKQRQLAYVNALKADLDNEITMAVAQGAPMSGGNAPVSLVVARTKYQKWSKWAELSGNNRQAENALKASTSINGVSISVNSLDQNPLLLGVANGVVELDRDEVRLRNAELSDFITLNTNVAWEEPTKFATEKWREYLNTFLPDPELQKIVQIVLGHCIIGGNPEKLMVVLKGDPNTGKSTMISALESALGDYCGTVSQTIFQNHKLNPVLANSITKRIIVCSEFDEKDELSASQVKRLTGGSDTISAELKGSNVTVEGVPQFVPILATNETPTISGADKALQNRLFVIPFTVTPKKVDKAFSRVIKDVCRNAVLGWLIEGYKEYRRLGGLPTSKLVEDETESFVADLDHLATFAYESLTETVEIHPIKTSEMHTKYEQWCVMNSIQNRDRASLPMLSRRLKALGFKTKKVKLNNATQNCFVNVKFKPNNVVDMRSRGTKSNTMGSDQ